MHASTNLLKKRGLKDTLPRRAVLQALSAAVHPMSVRQIAQSLKRQRQTMGLVTVYRVVDALLRAGLVHRHFSGDAFSLCTLPDVHGHHVLIQCVSCGTVREAHDHDLCKKEESVAKRLGFRSVSHASELLGTCSRCS